MPQEIKKCLTCKFCEERETQYLFDSVHKYIVCTNDETFVFRPQTFFQDGAKVALPEGFFTEVLVGTSFGCIHHKEKEEE